MKCMIYEYLRNKQNLDHLEGAIRGVSQSEAILVMATESEATEIQGEFGIDCISMDKLESIPRPRPVIIDPGAIIKEIEGLMALINEKSEIIMEISCTRPEVLKDAMEAVKRRK